ncbi:class I SAM-dependent methyltransferase [Roseomonas sp. BU-1]|uniref:Class I SAM-dependent methyltransferase n=2 Tax=Falsiroseomonas selenitidurans TaxID=2716335 RepID=A0ABX1E812_9PROT|nr:class I SAM-dependent methyltransferase [Falsiroseomonas selenitidurans]
MEPAEYALMDAAEDGMWWFRAAHARVLDALRARPGAEGPVLDAGCGTGGFLQRLAQGLPGRGAVGLEYVADAARRAAQKSGWPVAAGDANRLPFADASFGAAVSIDVICHAGVEPARGMAELQRVLRPGGTVVLNLPAYEWLRSAHDARVHTARRYTARNARQMAEAAGFTRVTARYWNGLLLPLMALQRKVLHRKPDAPSDVGDFPPWIDTTLHAVSEIERRIGRAGIAMPGGGSVLLIATRP